MFKWSNGQMFLGQIFKTKQVKYFDVSMDSVLLFKTFQVKYTIVYGLIFRCSKPYESNVQCSSNIWNISLFLRVAEILKQVEICLWIEIYSLYLEKSSLILICMNLHSFQEFFWREQMWPSYHSKDQLLISKNTQMAHFLTFSHLVTLCHWGFRNFVGWVNSLSSSKKTSQELRMLSLSLFIQGSLWMLRLFFSIVENVISVSKVTSL